MINSWVQTYTGRKFWPLNPEASDVCIEDIAHALSMKCRFSGHTTHFYSIAEHSIHVSALLEDTGFELWGLLHDASEAYLPDVASPIKDSIIGFRKLEHNVMIEVARAFGLWPPGEPAEVKIADRSMLQCEHLQAMSEGPAWMRFEGQIPQVNLNFWSPKTAEMAFLRRYSDLRQNLRPVAEGGQI